MQIDSAIFVRIILKDGKLFCISSILKSLFLRISTWKCPQPAGIQIMLKKHKIHEINNNVYFLQTPQSGQEK
jgi:hypothetical protein